MNWESFAVEMAKEGSLVTVKSLAGRLNVEERTAVNYLWQLRRKGFLETSRGRKGIRLYHILAVKKEKMGYPGLYETINRYSPIKLAEPYEHRVHDHKITPEEAIVRALLTGDYRVVLASLALFRKVSDWSLLYMLAKEKCLERHVGALYDLSRLFIRVRRMDGRIKNAMLASKQGSIDVIKGMKSRDFPGIEKKWRVNIPFSKGDMRRYKE